MGEEKGMKGWLTHLHEHVVILNMNMSVTDNVSSRWICLVALDMR